MRRLEMDFIKQTTISPVGVLCVFLTLSLLIVELYHYRTLQTEYASLEAKIQAFETTHKPKPVDKPKINMSQEQLANSLQHAHQMADFLLLPWMDVFAALEASADPDVAILGVEPEPKKQVVKIMAEAKDKAHMFEYMKKLEATPELTSVYLMRHEVDEEANQHPIKFVVAASWVSHVSIPTSSALAEKTANHDGDHHD